MSSPDYSQAVKDIIDGLGDSPTPDQIYHAVKNYSVDHVVAATASTAKAGGGGGGGLPASWTDNGDGSVVAATDGADVVTLKIQGVPEQAHTTPLFQVQDSDGADLLVAHESETVISSGGAFNDRSRILLDSVGDLNITAANGGQVAISGGNSGAGLNLKDGNDSPVRAEFFGHFFVKFGALVVCLNAAPDSADIGAGQCAVWFDSTNGAAKLMLKGKSANGTVVTGNVALA